MEPTNQESRSGTHNPLYDRVGEKSPQQHSTGNSSGNVRTVTPQDSDSVPPPLPRKLRHSTASSAENSPTLPSRGIFQHPGRDSPSLRRPPRPVSPLQNDSPNHTGQSTPYQNSPSAERRYSDFASLPIPPLPTKKKLPKSSKTDLTSSSISPNDSSSSSSGNSSDSDLETAAKSDGESEAVPPPPLPPRARSPQRQVSPPPTTAVPPVAAPRLKKQGRLKLNIDPNTVVPVTYNQDSPVVSPQGSTDT